MIAKNKFDKPFIPQKDHFSLNKKGNI